MKKINSVIILMFIFILILNLNFVNANYYWGQEANADYYNHYYDSNTGLEKVGYSSNHLNPINMNGTSYEICSITASDFTPIVANFGNLGSLKIVTTDADLGILKFYNSDCSLFRELDISSGTINQAPVLVNPKSYQNQQIAVVVYEAGTYLRIIEYTGDEFSVGTGDFVVSKSIAIAGGLPYAGTLTCFNHNYGNDLHQKCAISQHSAGSSLRVKIINIENETITEEDTYFVGNIYEEIDSSFTNMRVYTGLIDKENFYMVKSYLFDCNNDNFLSYGIMNLIIEEGEDDIFDGLYTFQKSVNYTSNVHTYTPTIYEDTLYIAKLGTSNYIFGSDLTTSSETDYYWSNAFISDMEGNKRIDIKGYILKNFTNTPDNITNKLLSNWVVADYDMDGSNEACILIKVGGTEVWLQCYKSSLLMSDGDIRVNYSGLIGNVSNFVLADFVSTKSVLGIATREGIFYPNDQVYSTGLDADFGYPIITFRDVNSLIPMYIIVDDEVGYIITSFNVTAVICGNGICEYWAGETELSCPEDCYEDYEDEEGEFREGSPCETDDDCADGLKCEYGICTKLGFNEECTSDDDCISGSCINGRCTKPSLWQGIDKSKDQMMGDDTNTNNLLSIIIMLIVSGLIGYYFVVWGGIASLFILAIFFTMVGWLSGFILVGLLIVGVIALVFGLIIGGKHQ